MRITSVRAHVIDFGFRAGSFSTSYGERAQLSNLLLVLTAEDGAAGFGEICQFTGRSPLPTEPNELRRIADACRLLVGVDSRDIYATVGAMGGNAPTNLKCGVDTALWDMMGRRTGQPIFRLLGGRAAERTAAYATLSSTAPDEMVRAAEVARQQGITRFQMKIEGKPDLDIARVRAMCSSLRQGEHAVADANGGLDVEGALALSRALAGLDVLLEEPCFTYEENMAVARQIDHGVMLDQCLSSPAIYARTITEGIIAGVGIKPTNLGGLAPARTARDLCIAGGLPMKVDDSWAADAGSLGAIHVAAGVPPDLLFGAVDMRGYSTGTMFTGGPSFENGTYHVGDSPGLGLMPLPDKFGDEVFSFGEGADSLG